MKIQCDACSSRPATLFCCADEAALCAKCDLMVHDANKLASKHRRLSLLDPPSDSLRCDICQEKRGLFFCQSDRAIFCPDCDVSIHSANEFTATHTRYLVSGARVVPRQETEGTSLQMSKVTTPHAESSLKAGKRTAEPAAPATFVAPFRAAVLENPLPLKNKFDTVAVSARSEENKENGFDTVAACASSEENSENWFDTNNETLQYLSEVEELLSCNSPEKLDWISMATAPCYQGEDLGKMWTDEWTASLGFHIGGDSSSAEVPCAPFQGGILSPFANLDMKPKPGKQQSLQVAWRSASHLCNSWVDDSFTVPDITGGFAPSAKRIRLDQQHFPSRFM